MQLGVVRYKLKRLSSLTFYIKYYKIGKKKTRTWISGTAMCVLAVYNKAQAQRISNSEFNFWTFLQGTESRVATFPVWDMCNVSPVPKPPSKSPTANHLQPWSLGVEHPRQITEVVRMFSLII